MHPAFRAKLHSGQMVISAFITFREPRMVEMCALLGLDAVVLDAEHAPLSPDQVEDLVRAADARGLAALVRVPDNQRPIILRYLDTGATGIHAPSVQTGHDATDVVRAVKYSPLGERGLASVRASDFGVGLPLPEYVRAANAATCIVAHIEDTVALDHLPELLACPEIDVYYLGPVDLSNSLGLPGETGHPAVQQRVRAAVEQIVQAGRVAGIIVNSAADVQRWFSAGVRYFAFHPTRLMSEACQQFLQACREVSP